MFNRKIRPHNKGTDVNRNYFYVQLVVAPNFGKEVMMKRLIAPGIVAAALVLGLAGCTNPYDPGQRAVGGGLLGAGAGAAIGGAVGGGHGAALGAAIGGASGAVTGAATTPPPPPPPGAYGQGYGYPPPPAPSGYGYPPAPPPAYPSY